MWVEDCWHENYAGKPSDSSAWTNNGDCTLRVRRGGSWGDEAKFMQTFFRIWTPTDIRDGGIGFRVARTLSPFNRGE